MALPLTDCCETYNRHNPLAFRKVIGANTDWLVQGGGSLRGILLACLSLGIQSVGATCVDYTGRVVARNDLGHTTFWSLQVTADLLQPAEVSLRDYRRWVRAHTSWSAREGLANLLRIYESSSLRTDPRFQVTIDNLRQVVSGRVGSIRAMNCLESLLFTEFLKVVDLRRFPSEGYATVLRKGNQLRILGDFYARPLSEGSRASRVSAREKRRLLAQGWSFWLSFHNHPFDFTNAYGDIGGNLAPSEADIGLYQAERPAVAVISNGMETVLLPAKDYVRLNPGW